MGDVFSNKWIEKSYDAISDNFVYVNQGGRKETLSYLLDSPQTIEKRDDR